MFDSFYPYKLSHHRYAGPDDGWEELFLYAFKAADNQRYLIELERYSHEVYGIKFYPKAWTNSPHRYSRLTGNGLPQPIIRTCLQVMVDRLELRPNASFAFISEAIQGESKRNTKRHRVYQQVMENFFPGSRFYHVSYEAQSAYLLFNRNQPRSLIPTIEQLFQDLFEVGEKDP